MSLSTCEASEAIGDFIRGDSVLEEQDISNMDEGELESLKSELESESSEVDSFKEDCLFAISRCRNHQQDIERKVSEIEERLEELEEGEDDEE